MRKLKLYVTALMLVFCFAADTNAFNGEKQGFVIGGGAGYAVAAENEIDGLSDSRVSSNGLALNFLAGYGYDDHTLFVFMKEGVLTTTFTEVNQSQKIFQGFTGVGICHYFAENGASAFLTSGIGLQHFTFIDSSDLSHETGLGFLVGGGYEFYEHVQAYCSFSTGKTKTTFNWNHLQLFISLNFMLY